VVTVTDVTPPVISSASATPSVLSPPNKQFVQVTVSMSAADSCGGAVHCRIVSVTSNEPTTDSDWAITGDLTVALRAERDNKGTGRIYTITIECVDGSGNAAAQTAIVRVPR